METYFDVRLSCDKSFVVLNLFEDNDDSIKTIQQMKHANAVSKAFARHGTPGLALDQLQKSAKDYGLAVVDSSKIPGSDNYYVKLDVRDLSCLQYMTDVFNLEAMVDIALDRILSGYVFEKEEDS